MTEVATVALAPTGWSVIASRADPNAQAGHLTSTRRVRGIAVRGPLEIAGGRFARQSSHRRAPEGDQGGGATDYYKAGGAAGAAMASNAWRNACTGIAARLGRCGA